MVVCGDLLNCLLLRWKYKNRWYLFMWYNVFDAVEKGRWNVAARPIDFQFCGKLSSHKNHITHQFRPAIPFLHLMMNITELLITTTKAKVATSLCRCKSRPHIYFCQWHCHIHNFIAITNCLYHWLQLWWWWWSVRYCTIKNIVDINAERPSVCH